jgi:hypothetical protein
VLEGLRGEENISGLCHREGIAASTYYGWSKGFLEAGKRRLAGDTARSATSGEVKDLRQEAAALKEVVADLTLEKPPLYGRGNFASSGRETKHLITRSLKSRRRSIQPFSSSHRLSSHRRSRKLLPRPRLRARFENHWCAFRRMRFPPMATRIMACETSMRFS